VLELYKLTTASSIKQPPLLPSHDLFTPCNCTGHYVFILSVKMSVPPTPTTWTRPQISPFPCKHCLVCRAGKSIIEMLLRGHQITVGGL